MKLLSALILGGKVRAVGAAPTDSAETALDDAAQGANAGSADAVLYIGGPPNPGVVSMFSSGRRYQKIPCLKAWQKLQITNWADLYLNPITAGSHMMRNQKTQDRLAT